MSVDPNQITEEILDLYEDEDGVVVDEAAVAEDEPEAAKGKVSTPDASASEVEDDLETLKGAKKAKKAKEPKTKPSNASSKVEADGNSDLQDDVDYTDVDTVLETIDCDEIKTVFGSDLTEEDQSKIETIFTAAVREKAVQIAESLNEAFETKTAEFVAGKKEEMTEQVDSYLDYIVEEWVKENQLAVESGVRGDIAESFIGGLKQLFEEHFITVPEGKYDMLEGLQDTNSDLTESVNEQIEKNMELHKELNAFKCREYFLESTRDLADTEIEKLTGLSESLETENFNDYQSKLDTLKEAYFNTPKAEADDAEWAAIAEEDEDSNTQTNTYVDPVVGSFASYISRQQKSNS